MLYGNQQNDELYGGQGSDVMYGGQNEDTLVGGAGNDTMFGNLGSDVFLFDGADGADVIADMTISDSIQITSGINGLDITTTADLTSLISSDASGNAVITLGTQTITVTGVSSTTLISDIDNYIQIV